MSFAVIIPSPAVYLGIHPPVRASRSFLHLPVVLLLCMAQSCGDPDVSVQETGTTPSVVQAKPRIIPTDSVAAPSVILIDETRLKKVRAGQPVIVPTNQNIHLLPVSQSVPAGTPRIITPGTDTFALPEVQPAAGHTVTARQPQPVASLPLRMKDAAACNIQYLDVDQGMNSSYIWDIFEDRYGNLWFATDGGGVSRYDGKSFAHFTEREGLSSNYVRSILEDQNGNIWFATIAGISRYDGKSFTNFSTHEGLKNNSVWSVMEDRVGNIWLSTYGGGVSRHDGKTFTHFTTEQGLSNNNVWTMLEDKSGNIWFATNGGGVTRYDGKSFAHYTTKEGLCNNTVLSIYEDENGILWFGTDGGVSRFDGKTFTNIIGGNGFDLRLVRAIYGDASGNLWFGTYGSGFVKYDGKSLTSYTGQEGLSDNHIVSIHEDEAHNLWLATYGGGIVKYNPHSFVHYTNNEGLTNYYIWSIIEDQSGALWMGTNGGGVVKYDGHSFSYFTDKEGLSNNTVRTLLEDKSGNIWFGTYGNGLVKFDGEYFTYYTTENGLAGDYILDIVQDTTGRLWFASDGGGVSVFDGQSFTNYTSQQGLSSNYVRCLMKDRKGDIWLGTNAGLSRFDIRAHYFVRYNEGDENGLRTIWSMCEDNSGNIWFGTGGYGVAKFKEQAFTYYSEQEGLSNTSVWSIVKDGEGNLWMGTERGLNCFLLSDTAAPVVVQFHREDGLKAEDFYLNSAIRQSNNYLWWGTGKSLTRLDMNHFTLNNREPRVQLNTISLREEFMDYRGLQDSARNSTTLRKDMSKVSFGEAPAFRNYPSGLELPSSLNHLTFYFSATDWSAPQAIRYQYQLEGLDPQWSQLTSENKADYRNIPYGKYTFKVRATGSARKWSETVEYAFEIHPPWWHTWWARTLGVIAVLAIIVLYIRWRERVLRARQIDLKRKINEATFEIKQQKTLIEEKHKAITDSINYAERIQRSFLATKELLDENLGEYFVLYLPKDVVSGDFYWATRLTNGDFALVTADSTGHGVPGAIMSLLNITSLEKATEYETEPARILNQTRDIIIDRLKKDGTRDGGWDGMDCSFIAFNFTERVMKIAAANNPVWILRKGELIEVKPDRFPVGKHEFDDRSFSDHEMRFEKGDMIYTMTDGFADQFGGPAGKKFKWKHLQKVLISNAHEPMNVQREKLLRILTDWKQDLEQIDDICVIGVRIN